MLLRKHRSANLEDEKSFQAKYMGCTTNTEAGVNGIDKAVKRIYDLVKYEEKTCPKITVEITKEGMVFTQGHKKQLFATKDISYCSLNRFDSNIFAFNHHISKTPLKVECHAIMCATEDKAKAIGQALYSSYRESHFEELRKERRKNLDRYQNEQSNDNNEPSAEQPITNKPNNDSYGNNSTKTAEQGSTTAEVDDKELDCIVQDMLNTVEREKEHLEEQNGK